MNVNDIIDSYLQSTTEFDAQLRQRTADEIAYDNAILDELRKGSSIEKSLDIAAEKYPNEALQYDDNSIDDIKAHYEYLLNHEAIKNRIRQKRK